MAIFNVEPNVVYTQLMLYGQIAFYTAIVGLLCWWWFAQSQYKIKAEIYRPQGGGKLLRIDDKIKLVKTGGVSYHYLKKLKDEIPPIQNYENVKLTGKGFGPKYVVKLFNPVPGVYFVIDGLHYDEKKIMEDVIPSDLQLHLDSRIERAKTKYSNQKKWEVLLPYIGIAGVIVLFIIVVYLMLERMDSLSGAWNGNMQGFLDLMKSCQGVQNIPQQKVG